MSSERNAAADLAEPFPYVLSSEAGAARENGKTRDDAGTAPFWFGAGNHGTEERERRTSSAAFRRAKRGRGPPSKRSWQQREAPLPRQSRRSKGSVSRISRESNRKWYSSPWPLRGKSCTAKPKWTHYY